LNSSAEFWHGNPKWKIKFFTGLSWSPYTSDLTKQSLETMNRKSVIMLIVCLVATLLLIITGSRGQLGRRSYDAKSSRRIGLGPADGSDQWTGLSTDYDTQKDHLSFAVNISRNVALSAPKTDGEATGKTTLSGVGLYGPGNDEAILVGQEQPADRAAITFQREGPVVTTQGTPAQKLAAVFGTSAEAKPIAPNDPTCLTANGAIGLPADRIGAIAKGPAAHITGVAMVDGNGITIKDSAVQIDNTVAWNPDGAAWLTPNGSPSRILWTAKRSTPSILGGGLPPGSP
tara:strand:+ start:6756 stop:7616 length:861 start_codon:yes stop_codon:yes gene_type:complete